jgi:hypothetical protein
MVNPVPVDEVRSPDWTALAAAAATVIVHLVFQAQGPNPIFIIGACLFWATFIVVRVCQDRAVLRRWGFRIDNLPRASVLPAAIMISIAAGFAWYAHVHGTLRFPPHAFLLLAAYPVWGVIQQFLALAIVVSNLELVPAFRRRRLLVVLIGAVLFGLVHGPAPLLVGGTVLLELACIPLYLNYRNLWPLGVLHGWLGALFYLWVLERDMWVENFG